jgi:hypothetical protein
MLNASDALSAHARCRIHFADLLKTNATHAPFFCELAPDQDCILVRYIREHAGDPALEPELTQLRTAHAAMHCVMIELAEQQSAGHPVDITAAFGSNGALGIASNVLIDTVHRLDRKLYAAHG